MRLRAAVKCGSPSAQVTNKTYGESSVNTGLLTVKINVHKTQKLKCISTSGHQGLAKVQSYFVAVLIKVSNAKKFGAFTV